MKVKKAVIPAAGLGTRVLPATKAMPKEMLPIVDKPSIQFIVEEAVKSGITDILIITNRGKGIIEDHFDRSPQIEQSLELNGKDNILNELKNISNLANIYTIRQKETKGLGHAISRAKSFAAGEPIAVLYGDDVIISKEPVCGQLIRAYEKYGLGVVGVKEVSPEDIHRYSSLKLEPLENNNIYKCTDMIEKPDKYHILSLFSIFGRCVLPYEIFDILENTAPGVGGEIQLTDAMRMLAVTKGMIAVDFEGTRYDMGNKLGILKATVEVALNHPEVKEEFKTYIKEIAKKL